MITFSGYANAAADEKSDKPSKEITLVADVWCPYNCDASSDKPGYMIEIAREVFARKDIRVNYQVMPWERAIQETREGKYNAIVGAGTDDAPDFRFTELPLGYTTNVIYVRADSKWSYEGLESLRDVSLGVIDGYAYEKNIDRYISNNLRNPAHIQPVAGETAMEQNFKKLEKGRIDAYIENMNVAQQFIADHNLWGKFKVAGIVETPDNQDHKSVYRLQPCIG